MGFILDPTPETDPWRIEIRGRCLTLYGGRLQVHRDAGHDGHLGFAVPVGQAHALRDAIGLALSNSLPSAIPTRDDAAPAWRTWEHRHGWLYLDGPCYGYGATGTGWVPAGVEMADGSSVGMLEVEHPTVLELHDALREAMRPGYVVPR